MNQPALWSFQGRASRSKFWLVFILTTTASLVLFFFTALAMPTLVLLGMFSPKIVSVFTIIVYILQVPLWVISIATSVRRFHDRNKSGWWYLVFMPSFVISWVPVSESLSLVVGIPLFLVTLWFLIELGFFKGTVGANNFGNNPLLPNVPSSPTAIAPSFATVVTTPSTPSGTSTGKLIMLIVGGIILIALLGRLGWAFWQVRLEGEQKIISQSEPTGDLKNLGINGSTGEPIVDAAPNREAAIIDPNAFVVTVGSDVVMGDQILDCKGDLGCFLGAMDNKCAPAKLNYTAYTDLSAMADNKIVFKIIYKRFFENKGLSNGGNCIVYEKDLGDSLDYDPVKLSQQPEDGKYFFQTLIDGFSPIFAVSMGIDDTCVVTPAEFKEHIYRLTHLVALYPNPYQEKCTKKGLNVY